MTEDERNLKTIYASRVETLRAKTLHAEALHASVKSHLRILLFPRLFI